MHPPYLYSRLLSVHTQTVDARVVRVAPVGRDPELDVLELSAQRPSEVKKGRYGKRELKKNIEGIK